MEDKYNDNDKYNMQLLKKKNSRRKKLQKLDKEFDIEKYKEKIFRELGQKELVYNNSKIVNIIMMIYLITKVLRIYCLNMK